MTLKPFQFDEAKQAKIKEDRARMHWNLLVDAKKEPIKVREALLASVFDEVIGSLLFIDSSMSKEAPVTRYQLALVKVIGETIGDLIHLVELKKDYDEHLDYIRHLKSKLYEIDKVVFNTVHAKSTEESLPQITVKGIVDKVTQFSKEELKEKRVTVLLGADTTTELLNYKDFVEVFEPNTDQSLLLSGKLGKIKVGELEVPVLTDGMRSDEDRCLRPESVIICDEFQANLRVRHNHTWASLIFDVKGLITGVNEYVYTSD